MLRETSPGGSGPSFQRGDFRPVSIRKETGADGLPDRSAPDGRHAIRPGSPLARRLPSPRRRRDRQGENHPGRRFRRGPPDGRRRAPRCRLRLVGRRPIGLQLQFIIRQSSLDFSISCLVRRGVRVRVDREHIQAVSGSRTASFKPSPSQSPSNQPPTDRFIIGVFGFRTETLMFSSDLSSTTLYILPAVDGLFPPSTIVPAG